MPHSNRRDFLRIAAVGGLGATLGLLDVRAIARAAAAQGVLTRFAICNETFQDWPFDKAFALAAECGYTGLEIAPFTISNYVTDIPAARRAEIRKLAEKNRLEIIGLHWLLAKTEGFYLTSPDSDVRRKTARYFVELGRLCVDLGGKLMVLGSPKQRSLLPGVTREKGMEYAADVLREAMPEMEKLGVTIALEPLTPKETDFLNTAADGVELMRLVDSPRCRLHLDCKAMAGTESSPIPDVIRKYREPLFHFHANDPNLQGPGMGQLDFVPILAALREINYPGWVSVEVFDYKPGPERLARESIDYMRRCLKKLPG
jgi:sugar phosphate isomerase/epimerase